MRSPAQQPDECPTAGTSPPAGRNSSSGVVEGPGQKSKRGNNKPPGSSRTGGLVVESSAGMQDNSGSSGRLETSRSGPGQRQLSSCACVVSTFHSRLKVYLSDAGSGTCAGGHQAISGALKQSVYLSASAGARSPIGGGGGGSQSSPSVVRFTEDSGSQRELKPNSSRGTKAGVLKSESSTTTAATTAGKGGRTGRAELKKTGSKDSSTGPLADGQPTAKQRKSMPGGGKESSSAVTSGGRLDTSKAKRPGSGFLRHFSLGSLQLESSSTPLQSDRAATGVIAAGTSPVPLTLPRTASKQKLKKKKKNDKTTKEIFRDLRLITSKSNIEELQYDRSRQSVVDLARVSQLFDANARISAVKVKPSFWSLPRAPPLYKPLARCRPVLLQIGGAFLKVGNGNAPAVSTVQPPLYPFVPYNDLDHLLEERPPRRVLNPDTYVYGPFVFLADECVTVLETWLRSSLTICNLRLSALRAAESRGGRGGLQRIYLAVVSEGPRPGGACSLLYRPNPDGAWWQLTGLGGDRFLAESVSCPGACLKKGLFGLTLSAPLTNKDRIRIARGQCDPSLVLTIVSLPDAAVQPIAVVQRDQQPQQSAQKSCWHQRVKV